nr:MAG TPA: hypothetical protein [Caudoviricetes sp.]
MRRRAPICRVKIGGRANTRILSLSQSCAFLKRV